MDEHDLIVGDLQAKILASEKTFMRKVYAWMGSGLAITALTSYFIYSTGLYQYLLNTWAILFVIILQFSAVIFLSARANKMSPITASFTFIAYAFLTGLTFSIIFLAYSSAAIFNAFITASATFAALSLFGFVTKKDLTGWGSFFFIGLIGVIIAMVVNIFLANSALDFVISIVGVLVFAGLTAYDTQKLKEMHLVQLQGKEATTSASIVGALVLYLDFINLFLMLLRLFGGGRG